MVERICLRVIIEGRVQGVGFRGWTIEQAKKRGLDGWVRNHADGSVEALFSGASDAVVAMVQACRHGPSFAHVVSLHEMPAEIPRETGFRPLPTL
jgi:acylphosphatase